MDKPTAEPLEAALYVVSTPIGNLGDFTSRAIDVLCRADVIACEDTRTTGRLLARIESSRPTLSYHEHNELPRATELANKIAEGQSVALVCDAGTPTLSDPGFRVVRECRKREFAVIPVPGASALLAALASSGLPTDAFFYAGFLPPKSAARRTFLERHRDFPHTIVVYESCHRIGKFVAEIKDVLGPDRVVCIAREITKKFESIHTGTINDLATTPGKIVNKGEFVVLIANEDFTL